MKNQKPEKDQNRKTDVRGRRRAGEQTETEKKKTTEQGKLKQRSRQKAVTERSNASQLSSPSSSAATGKSRSVFPAVC